MKTRLPLPILAVLGLARAVWSQETPPTVEVLPKDFNADKENQMMRAYLRGRVGAALDERLAILEALDTPERIAAYQKRLRGFFRETVALDSFARGPLRPRVTGRLERDGYVVENVIFESLPGFHVTGNLYLPSAGEGPFPAILHPCGHTDNGKAGGAYQMANILLARSGFAVLCYDPIGQGERRQLIDPRTGKSATGSTGEHQVLGVAPVPLGRGLSSYMIWDGMRAIDYLQSRPEVDPERIGCTGNSGGGNMTAFLMALDERIAAAAPGCFMTTTRRKNESPGPGDAEQNLFAQIREGLDHPDFAIVRAPKPTLILAATHDFVPIAGTWENFRQAKRVYTKLGYPERIDLIEAPEKHGFTKRLREGAARFFSHWLKGEDGEIFEPQTVPIEKDADLQCTPKGQVLALEGERTLFDLNREYAAALKERRTPRWRAASVEEKREIVRETLNYRDISFARTRPSRFGEEADPVAGSTFVFSTEDGISIPAIAEAPVPAPAGGHALLLHEGGTAGARRTPEYAELVKRTTVLSVDLRDIGETRTRVWRFPGADAWIAYLLGDSYLAMRTEDVIAIAKGWKPGEPPVLHAWGELVPVAIHAAALEPDLFESVTLHGGLTSWESLLDARDPLPHWHSVVHGALRHYDLADLLEMIPAEKLVLDPEN
ncbi:MAG: acetylxylan esterase [Akkermansiaceae bacterium]|nr:acetylxylan esterase [Akkermansiaceae bacterium]